MGYKAAGGTWCILLSEAIRKIGAGAHSLLLLVGSVTLIISEITSGKRREENSHVNSVCCCHEGYLTHLLYLIGTKWTAVSAAIGSPNTSSGTLIGG